MRADGELLTCEPAVRAADGAALLFCFECMPMLISSSLPARGNDGELLAAKRARHHCHDLGGAPLGAPPLDHERARARDSARTSDRHRARSRRDHRDRARLVSRGRSRAESRCSRCARTIATRPLRIAFEVGNHHFPLAIDGDELLVPDDTAMVQLLDAARRALWTRR